MTLFLASVTDDAEARAAAASDADIVDAKDPASGALGALPEGRVAAIARAVAGRVPMSATIGDLAPDPKIILPAVAAKRAAGTDIVKIGLFPGANDRLLEALAPLARRMPLVALLLADRDLDFDFVPAVAQAGFVGIMLDTASKDGRSLLDHADLPMLSTFIARAHAAGLFAGLAGSLRLAHIPPLLRLRPDLIGFRGALCMGSDRAARLDPAAMATVRAAIPRDPAPRIGSRARPAA